MDEIGCERRQSIELALRPSVFEHDLLAFNKARLIQSFSKRADDVEERRGGPGVEKSHHRHRRLLRARRERPSHHSTAEKCDELAAAAHSITSSAATSKPAGTVRPRAFTVLMLTTVSYLVGTCTGRSAGLAISLSSSSHFAPKPNSLGVKPVIFPPGRARLATKPMPTGSLTFA